MKRFFMLLFAVVAFAACEHVYVDVANDMSAGDRSLSVSFEDDDTRIQLNEAQKTVWTKGDLVSVFYRSSVNEQWQFDGETGDRVGDIVPVDNSVNPPATHNRVVVVYPYNAGYFLNTETYSIEASLPAVQSYLKDSYGTDGNIMVSSSNYKQVSLKSVCGWLKLQLTGNGEVVKSITFKGNNGEQVAGEIYVNTADATCVLASASGAAGDDEVGGTLVRPGTILYDVTLDCGEGVTLGAEPTAFYIALPPQTFTQGFTVDVECEDYKPMTISTENTVTIERNHIQPMAAMEFTPPVPNNQIWYTSSDGNVVTPNDLNAFGLTIKSNTYSDGKGVITFDGDVTEIGEEAFYRCNTLIGVTIPDSVTTIGKLAFTYCVSLTRVTIPDSVTTIEYGAFYGCNSLSSITIPDSVTTIGDSAFDSCSSLTSIIIPDNVTTIGDGVFASCESLTSITIPDSVTSIGIQAFAWCHSLTSVTIPDSVTTIGYGAFADCSSLAEFKGKFAEDNGRIWVVNGTLIAFASGGISEYTIPNSVTTIGHGAFHSCINLTSVTIPDSVTTIGSDAFVYCLSLTSVTIPDSVKSIGDWAFFECTSLTSVNIPDSVTSIGEKAFAYCYGLTSVNIPDSVTTIGYGAFANCDSLTSITIPNSVTTIGERTFHWCTSLTSVTIPDSVTTIGDYAFYFCKSLISVTIPDSVTTIGERAFWNCESLTSVTIPDSVTTIGDGAFCECDSLTSVNIPDSVTTIGNEAFNNCTSLTSVTIPDSVTTIGEYAFGYCDSLTSVTIGDSVTTIGLGAFYACDSLTSVNIPDSVTTIGNYAFYACDSLTSVYCTSITPPTAALDYYDEWYAFDSNASDRKIYVPYESVDAYKITDGWSEYASDIVGYDFENGVVVE